MSRHITLVLPLALLAVTALAPAIASADSAFSNQGDLEENGQAADGPFAMAFSLWDDPVAGGQIGASIDIPDVAVTGGRFTVQLDFGADAFDNSARWLEIAVGGYTLAPRNPITRAPYAIQTRGIFVDEAENVGIGTTAPQRQLEVQGSEPALRIYGTDANPGLVPALEFKKIDAAGIHKPLGALRFIDQNDDLMASITGTKVGSTSAELTFSATPGETPHLRINSSGVQFRDGIRPPIAYGQVDGILLSGSTNIVDVETWEGEYTITFSEPLLETDIAVASLAEVGFITATVRDTGKLDVRTYSWGDGHNPQLRRFYFVVYRP